MTNEEKKDFLLLQQENLALKHKLVSDELQALEAEGKVGMGQDDPSENLEVVGGTG